MAIELAQLIVWLIVIVGVLIFTSTGLAKQNLLSIFAILVGLGIPLCIIFLLIHIAGKV